VDNPFIKNASFNFELYKEHIGLAQRMMDDIIDLELEKIDAIIAKIEADPESEELKRVEKNLWKNIRKKSEEGEGRGSE
jgi:ribonucleoside-diphosphate reductase alpha chain